MKAQILLIDDEPLILDLAKDLDLPDIEVITCDNVASALRIMHNHTLAAIISDVVMPDGELLDRILKQKANDLLVCRMSGTVTRHLNLQLLKPFKVSELKAKILELVALSQYMNKRAA